MVSNASITSVMSDFRGPYYPGQKIYINNFEITIEQFIAEGGFAHVYTCLFNDTRLCLKRVSCGDAVTLKDLIKEAETHKFLSGHPSIVKFIDYSYAQLSNGTGYELVILMEHCAGNLK